LRCLCWYPYRVTDFLINVLGGITATAVLTLFTARVWPHRKNVLPFLRQWRAVKGVNLYLSVRGDAWNIEVPFKYEADVRWRFRSRPLNAADHYSSSISDEHASAFRLSTA